MSAHPCPPDCKCGKHNLRNSGQFQPGGSGFRGPHSEETKAKIRETRARQSNIGKPPWPGDPNPRFDAKVYQEPNTGCHLWAGAASPRGYGAFGVGSRRDGSNRVVRAHRFAYERSKGPIPDGLVIDHICSTPSCVNPAHLEAVTQRENLRRGRERRKATV